MIISMVVTLKKDANITKILNQVKRLKGLVYVQPSILFEQEKNMFSKKQMQDIDDRCLIIICDSNINTNKGWNAASYAYQEIEGTGLFTFRRAIDSVNGLATSEVVETKKVVKTRYTIRCTDLLFPQMTHCLGSFESFEAAQNGIANDCVDTERFKHTVEKL